MRKGQTVAVAVAVSGVLALAGCAPGHDPDPPSPSAKPSHAAPASRSTPTPTPTASSSTPGGQAEVIPGRYVGIFPAQIPTDLGAREFAHGTVDVDSDGVPAAYHVASGDVVDYIAARFGLSSHLPDHPDFDYLNTINQVRRGGYPWKLFASDTLNLSASTVTSVGDINGVVRNDPAPSPLPPQR